MYDCFRIAAYHQVFFEFHKALLKCCFLVLSSLIASALMKPILTSGEWHELKDFSRFVVSFDVQDGFVF